MRLYLIVTLFLTSPLISVEPLSLSRAEAITLTQNKELLALKELLASAQQGRLESLSKWLPAVNLISRGYATEETMTSGGHSAFLSQVALTQTLFSSDRYYDVKLAALVVEQLRLLVSALTIDLLFKVRTSYYRVILDKEMLATAQRNVEILTSLAERMESNYAIGTSILLNVNQSKVAIANATALYYQALKQHDIDVDALVTIMGYDPGSIEIAVSEETIPLLTIPDIASKVEHVETIFARTGNSAALYKPGFPKNETELMARLFSDEEIQSWEATALCYRPDLKAKCTEVKMAQQELYKQQGHYLPEVTLQANYGGYPENMDDYPSRKFTDQNFYGAIGLKLEWLLFDSWGRTYQVRQARHARNAKKLAYTQGIQLTYEEVRKQIFSMKESIANYVTAQSNVQLAEQTLELGSRQLNIGTITIFDYQTLVNGLIEALNIRNRARYNLIAAYYGLKHASGADLICRSES